MVNKLSTIALLFCTLAGFGQLKELNNEHYFKNNFTGIIQPLPFGFKWVDDSHFTYSKDGKQYFFDCTSKTETAYTEPAILKGSVIVRPIIVNKNNNLYIRKNVADEQITFDEDKETNPTLSPDGNYVAYTKNNNLYCTEILSKKETQLTSDGSEVILNGYASWVYMEEILGRGSAYKSFWWSPDSKQIAFFRTDDSKVPLFTIADANGQHGKVELQRYPKSGDPNPEVKIGIVKPAGGPIVWADVDQKDDPYFGMPYWRPDSKALWATWINRGQDNYYIYEIDLIAGTKKEIYNEKQNTWINLDEQDKVQFLEEGKGVFILSDKTGWKHIYHYDLTGKLIQPVTTGKYTVMSIEKIDNKKQMVYFIARSRENSARRDFYRVKFNGKDLTRMTFGAFNHSVNLSPNGSYAITNYNNASTPSSIAIIDQKGKMIKEFATAKGPEFDNYHLAKTELVRVKSDDGLYELPLKITWPLNFDKNKKYPVLVSIYGGPDAGTVWDNWSLRGTQQFFAKEGLIQVAMDHRGSGHFGKEGINYMHRRLGYWEMVDYTTMVKWLIANAGADEKKICITGFSYGGYLSCYALTYGAGTFTHGMAGGSVTDWSLYDTHYTERLMDSPMENPKGYISSNPITHAEKYKGVLQLVHGMIDDNVHFQNSIQLLSKMQDLKKDVEFMPYSGGRHGWSNLPGKSAHFDNLKTKFIYKYLLEKEVPKEMIK